MARSSRHAHVDGYRFAERPEAMLGKTGANVLTRLSAFILLCIGIEIISSGAGNLINSLRS
jgi:multiple antibiotic resistance protein